ncbi:hypothetical protein DER45DRAFT_543630 [Fusarium avenaceum]|nr:hypothetical protein DER45DRAFT_543630 [Fusarium avenaceum]
MQRHSMRGTPDQRSSKLCSKTAPFRNNDNILEISMNNPTDTRPNTVIEIASDGDLILLVGPEESKFRVRSVLLMAASKPFSAMLGPHWKEGHDKRDHDGLFELKLPDDDAAALKTICSIIHYQNEKYLGPFPLATSSQLLSLQTNMIASMS